MQDLFSQPDTPDTEQQALQFKPLADRLRPASFDHYHGQQHLLAKEKPLRKAIESGNLHSMILWGPPGTGKTTLARLIANYCDAEFLTLSAVLSGVKDIRAAIQQAQQIKINQGRKSILFVDEVHRFNKSQQDAFLPYVEDGTVTFIGATTENPSFELNNALLSRARVYVLKSLDAVALGEVIDHALSDTFLGLANTHLILTAQQREQLIQIADGDARKILNMLEIASELGSIGGTVESSIEASDADESEAQSPASENMVLSDETFSALLSQDARRFDKKGEAFYDQISALHKSVRGSAPNAALYWFTRMIDGGCDPLYLARRVVRMASEDIGNADPRALDIALKAWEVQERLGSPEGELAIAQAILYMASAAKSNAVYSAYNQAMQDAKEYGSLEVPLHLRNAPTKLMKELDYGTYYRYAHDEPEAYAAGENYFPQGMPQTEYYKPVARGLEIKIAEKLAYLKSLDAKARNKK